jgi:hypothetical protein
VLSWVTEYEDEVMLSESLNVKMRLCCPESLNVRMSLCCPESLNMMIYKIPSYWSRPVHFFHILHQISFLYLGLFSIITLS